MPTAETDATVSTGNDGNNDGLMATLEMTKVKPRTLVRQAPKFSARSPNAVASIDRTMLGVNAAAPSIVAIAPHAMLAMPIPLPVLLLATANVLRTGKNVSAQPAPSTSSTLRSSVPVTSINACLSTLMPFLSKCGGYKEHRGSP